MLSTGAGFPQAGIIVAAIGGIVGTTKILWASSNRYDDLEEELVFWIRIMGAVGEALALGLLLAGATVVYWVACWLIALLRGTTVQAILDEHEEFDRADCQHERIRQKCPECGRHLYAKRSMIGDVGVCTRCRHEFTITE